MISWTAYARWFTESYNAIFPDLLEARAVECNGGPLVKPTDYRYPTQAPWRAEWGIIFADGNYFRVKECFRPIARQGEREHFSFHYGRAYPRLDSKGYPETNPKLVPPPADLRIDKDAYGPPHIHVRSTEHIHQNRVEGFVIEDAHMFKFLEAVRDHRKTHEPLADILKIRVIK